MNRSLGLLILALAALPVQAGWKTPREALDQRVVQDEFRIHYTLDGPHAFYAATSKERIDRLLAQIAQANRYYTEQLGLERPLSRARYRAVRAIDVHILKLEGEKGSTGDEPVVYHYRNFADAMPALTITLTNQWAPQQLTPNHEVFHAYQYGYTVFKNAWYLEGMARSMENAFRTGEVRTDILPRDAAQLEQVMSRSYGADKLWNRLRALCDAGLIRATLEQYQALDKEAARVRNIDPQDWPEEEQRSEKNNPYLLLGLRRAIETQCPLHGNPELETFHRLLQ